MQTLHLKCAGFTVRHDGQAFAIEIVDAWPQPLWDKEQAAEFFKVTTRTIENYCRRKNNPLPSHVIGGGLLRFRESELINWSKSNK